MSKPASEELLLWKWLQEKYYIDQNVYEEDIEFALPAGWICSLSADKNLFTVKNDQGLALFHLVESKDGSSKAFFLKKNFEILQSTFKN